MKKSKLFSVFFGLMIGFVSALIFIWGVFSLSKQILLDFINVIPFLIVSLIMNTGAVGIISAKGIFSTIRGILIIIVGVVFLLFILDISMKRGLEPTGILLALTVIMVTQGLFGGRAIEELNILFFLSMLVSFSLFSLSGSYFVINILK